MNDISVPAGQAITLPIPERDGFLFAGWYTADKEKYTATRMPTTSVELKAGWYKEKEETIIIYNSTADKSWAWSNENKPQASTGCWELKLTDYTQGNDVLVKIGFHMACKAGSNYPQVTLLADFYTQKQVSSVYYIKTITIGTCTNSSYSTYEYEESFFGNSNVYVMYYLAKDQGIRVQDFYYTIHYPDTTNLYL